MDSTGGVGATMGTKILASMVDRYVLADADLGIGLRFEEKYILAKYFKCLLFVVCNNNDN